MATYNARIVGEGDSLAEEVRHSHSTSTSFSCKSIHHSVTVFLPTFGVLSTCIAWQVKLLKTSISKGLKTATDEATLDELNRAKGVLEGHGPGGDLRKLLKQPTPALLKLLLGQHCNVVTLQVSHTAARCHQEQFSSMQIE